MTGYYFAARYSRHPEMRRNRDELTASLPGAKVTARWIDLHGDKIERSFTEEELASDPAGCWPYGETDLADIDAADVLVSFTGPVGKGGRHVEHGYAMARGLRIVIVGPRDHIFHTHPATEVFPDWDAFLAFEVAQRG